MPKSKTAIAIEEKATKAKMRKPLRDINPGTKAKNSFMVHQVRQDEDTLSVEPLIENANDLPVSFNVDRIESQQDNSLSHPHNMGSVEDFEDDEIDVGSFNNREELPPKETVKVKFSKFVQLVANHDFGDVVDANANEEIIMSSNLLTELAGAHDQRGEKKIPLVFLVGIAIGVVLTYILFST